MNSDNQKNLKVRKPKSEIPNGAYLSIGDLGPDLTEENCSPEAWEFIGGVKQPIKQKSTFKQK
jgi:hypothetical protein